jgi:plastocyanin
MTRRHIVPVVALIAIGLAAAGCGGKKSSSSSTDTTTTAASSGGTTLEGSVGPGFDISLMQNGQSVTTLKPGTYTLNVDDQASSHNFHLTGPGVDVTTDVSGMGKKTFTITLKDGSYHFQCDPHSSQMNGDFTVG